MSNSAEPSSENEPKTTKTYHHGDLRNALLASGKALLAEEGIAGLELRKVARRAGVSHAAPYRHFADKQALLVAIAQEGFEELSARLRLVPQQGSGEVQALLLEMGRVYVQFALEHPDLMREMFSGLTIDRAAYPGLYAASKQAFAQLVAIIERGQADGTIVAGDATNLTVVTWSLIHGLAMLLLEKQLGEMTATDPALSRMIQFALQTLYDGIKQN